MTVKARTVLLAAPNHWGESAGDEAILAGMIAALRAAIPDVELTVVSGDADRAASRYGVQAVDVADIVQLFRAAQAAELMILGTGLISGSDKFDPSSILTRKHNGLAFHAGFALLATLLRKPLMIYGVGVGSIESASEKSFARFIFEQAEQITVRDLESKLFLQAIEVDPERISVMPDPALGLPNATRKHWQRITRREGWQELPRPFVGVVLRDPDLEGSGLAWEAEVAAALDAFLDEHNGSIFFVPFVRQMNAPPTDDRAVAERVRELMRRAANAIVLDAEHLTADKRAILQNCDLILGMRLHSVIFAIQSATPAVAIICDPRVLSLMREVEAENSCLDLSEVNSSRLASLLNESYRDRARLSRLFKPKAKALKKLSHAQALLARGLISSHLPARDLSPFSLEFFKWIEVTRLLRIDEIEDQLKDLKAAVNSSNDGDAPRAKGLWPILADVERERLSREFAVVLEPAAKENAATAVKPRPAASRTLACLTNRLLDWETGEPRFGGGERYCLTLGMLLRDLGFDVTFYQSAREPFVGDHESFKVVGLPHGAAFSEFQHGVGDQFFEISADYDCVIYNAPNYASGRVRDDAILICHGIWFDYDSPSYFAFRTREWFEHLYRIFSQPGKVVSVDANSINVVRALWPELAGRMTHLPNWVDTQLFHPPDRRAHSTPTIIIPRRNDPLRGSKLLGPILERISEDCRVLWVGAGEGEEDTHMEELAEQDTRFEFQHATFEQMPELYREADICLIPTVAGEGTSLSCLEALASGCAVIATTVGGLPELVHSEVNGLLVEPQADHIARAVNRLLSSVDDRTRFQQAAIQTARGFSLEIWRQRWRELLGELGWIDATATDKREVAAQAARLSSNQSGLTQSQHCAEASSPTESTP